MKKLLTILSILLLVTVLFAGCIQEPTQNPVEDEKVHYTYGFFDKSPHGQPLDLEDHMTYYINWRFDYENATGFDVAKRREATENRYIILSLTPGSTGCVPVEITAPEERDVTVRVGTNPDMIQATYPNGFSAVLGDGEVVVPAGETVTALLYISLAEDAGGNNDTSPTQINLVVQEGVWVGYWCLLLNSNDPYVPEFG